MSVDARPPDSPTPQGSEPDRRQGAMRRTDWLQMAADGFVVLVVIAFVLVVLNVKSQREHDQQVRAQQRTADLREQCRRASGRTAADVNLNWVNYQSEARLATGSQGSKRARQLLALLTPGEQRFIATLEAAGKPTARVVGVLADANFNAAFVKARTIDTRDIGLVAAKTPLGPSPELRRWVRAAHFSCWRAYQ